VGDASGVQGGGFDVRPKESSEAVGVPFRIWVKDGASRMGFLGDARKEAANVSVLCDVILVGEEEGAAAPKAYPAAVDAAGVGTDVNAAFCARDAGASFSAFSHDPSELAWGATEGRGVEELARGGGVSSHSAFGRVNEAACVLASSTAEHVGPNESEVEGGANGVGECESVELFDDGLSLVHRLTVGGDRSEVNVQGRTCCLDFAREDEVGAALNGPRGVEVTLQQADFVCAELARARDERLKAFEEGVGRLVGMEGNERVSSDVLDEEEHSTVFVGIELELVGAVDPPKLTGKDVAVFRSACCRVQLNPLEIRVT